MLNVEWGMLNGKLTIPAFLFLYRGVSSLAGQAVALKVVVLGVSTNYYYLHTDHLGSTSLATTISGSLVSGSTARYYPFGDWRTEPTASLTDRGFTGHTHDNLTGSNDIGLIYMQARYYLPSVGRFASADTLIPNPTNPQSFNRYSYVDNNPINYTDPSGHFTEEAIYNYLYGLYGDRAYEVFGEWKSVSEWWEILRAAQAGDVFFGHTYNGVFHTFDGVGEEELRGIYLSDAYGNRVERSGYEKMVSRDLGHRKRTLQSLFKYDHNHPIGFMRWENEAPSFFVPSNGTITQKQWPSNGGDWSWWIIPGYAAAQDLVAELVSGGVGLAIPAETFTSKIALLFGAAALDEWISPTDRYRNFAVTQPGDVHVTLAVDIANGYHRSITLRFHQEVSSTGAGWKLMRID